MKKQAQQPYVLNSISGLHQLLALPKPEHQLVSVVDFKDITCFTDEKLSSVVYNFYSVCIKKDFKGKLKYGQRYYDFDEGVMTFISPGQVIAAEITEDMSLSGWWLLVHPDFIRSYPLAKKMKDYGFFSYAVNEALHLSQKEEAMIVSVMHNIEQEYRSPIDKYSQDVMVSHIELLLNYSNRFYNRQFITRKVANDELLVRLETLLASCFDMEKPAQSGLPTVQYISGQLNISADYLSDMLRAITGQSTQQHIHNKLIEKAKEILTTTSLSVSEIAYSLGFGYPQSFSKLFKSKTSLSPLQFKQSFALS